jgi:acyl-coenzyme A synthetase/AMP-(fatty) acid ligase
MRVVEVASLPRSEIGKLDRLAIEAIARGH